MSGVNFFDRTKLERLCLQLLRDKNSILIKRMSLPFHNCYRNASVDSKTTPDLKVNSVLLHRLQQEQHVCQAVELLTKGNVIALPTDTVYGLAGAVQNTEAVEKLYELKGRDLSKPFAICVSSVEEIDKWADTSVLPATLLHSILPGPYTVVIRRSDKLNATFNPGITKVGVRVPKHNFVTEVVKRFGYPLALTSANSSGEKSSVTTEEFAHLWPKISAIFDDGRIPSTGHTGSTVVDLSEKGKYKIIRIGIGCDTLRCKLESYGLNETFGINKG